MEEYWWIRGKDLNSRRVVEMLVSRRFVPEELQASLSEATLWFPLTEVRAESQTGERNHHMPMPAIPLPKSVLFGWIARATDDYDSRVGERQVVGS
ncbi:hypothetical protein DLJ96_02490 [Actinotalea fermentans ATCC 43279 = JCM 9966 = DSM 3133]|nr:hypothetical protein DLJ96_02490 [Actinotalea fermentans ATCC 43279 = JCM 9966 = DSM 3133]